MAEAEIPMKNPTKNAWVICFSYDSKEVAAAYQN